MKFNYQEKKNDNDCGETVNECFTIDSLGLKPCQWEYPDDCFYIKMYITAPLAMVKTAFGPRHGFGDQKSITIGLMLMDVEDEYSEWTFAFEPQVSGEDESGVVNQFQLRGHGKDKKTKLHDIRHIVMNNHSLRRYFTK